MAKALVTKGAIALSGKPSEKAFIDEWARQVIGKWCAIAAVDSDENEYTLILGFRCCSVAEMREDVSDAKSVAKCVLEERAYQVRDYFVLTYVDNGETFAEFSDFDKDKVKYEKECACMKKMKIHKVSYSSDCVKQLLIELNKEPS